SATAASSAALARARAKLTKLKEPSATISTKKPPRARDRDPAGVPIADVVAIYTDDVVGKHARPKETAARLGAHSLRVALSLMSIRDLERLRRKVLKRRQKII